MICPKCGKEMEYGKLGVSINSRGIPPMFWAPEEVFNCVMPSMLTVKKAEKKGGVHIPIGNGLIRPRNTGYICKDCHCVLINY